MFILSGEIPVDRPVEAVFDFLADLDRYPDWQPAIERAELIGAASPAPGGRFAIRLSALGRDIVVDGSITQFRRPHEIGVRLLTGPASVTARCDFDRLPGGRSRVRVHAEVQPQGLLRFAEGAIRDRATQELPGALASLRADIERHVPPQSGSRSHGRRAR